MEIQTSEEAWELYRKLQDEEERANKYNGGQTLFRNCNVKPSFFISVKKVVKLNILESEEELLVTTNVLDGSGSWGGDSVVEFLENLKKEMSAPKYNSFIEINRRYENKNGSSRYTNFRKNDFKFEDIKIEIGEEAKIEMEKISYDFVKKVKDIVDNKRILSKGEEKDFDRFVFLLNRIEDLKRQKIKENDYSYYSSREDTRTLKISISDEEFNEKLHRVEDEMKELCKNYDFLESPSFYYVEIKEPLVFKDWEEENESDMREEWDGFDDDRKEDFDGDYNAYVESCFNDFAEDY